MTWTTDTPHIDGVAWWRDGRKTGIAFDYDPDAVDRIKQIPSRKRKYDPGLRCWYVLDGDEADVVIDALLAYTGGTSHFSEGRPDWITERADWITTRGWEKKRERQEDDREQRQQRRGRQREHRRGRREQRERNRAGEGSSSGFAPKSHGPYAVLNLTNDAPPELVAAAYRALAKLHHPDAGGDEERMKAINNAFEELTQ
jgi:hypothetical protein